MNYILVGGVIDWFWETINYLFLFLTNLIYSVIALLYRVFQNIAKVNLFSEEVFDQFVGRIYIIVGIAMLFIFAYNLILMIIDPNDKKSTGQMKKVVKETIISLILVILLPTIFNWMYIFQNHVLESNIIGKIMMGDSSVDCTKAENMSHYECNCYNFANYDSLESYQNTFDVNFLVWNIASWDYGEDKTDSLISMCRNYSSFSDSQKGALSIPPILIQAFYKPTNFSFDECEEAVMNDRFTGKFGDDKTKNICVNYFFDVVASKFSGDISPFIMDNYLMGILIDNVQNLIEFNGILAIAAGVIALLMFASYCVDVGSRVAKLGLLQILSPVAVMMRIIPKQKEAIYDKWFKQLVDTYLDVFMRLFIIFFTMFVISLIPNVVDTLWGSYTGLDEGVFVKTLVMVFLILGLLRFAQEAPGLIKDFFGNGSGKFALKNPFKDKTTARVLDTAKAGVYGATTGQGWKGRVGGFLSGAARGARGGYDKAVKGLDTARTERENGSTWYNRTLDRARVGIGMETRGEADTRRINRLDEKIKNNDEIRKNYKQPKDIVSKAIENEKSKITIMNGQTYTQLKQRYEEMMLDASNITDARAREQARDRAKRWMQRVNDEKDKVEAAAITDLLKGGNYGGTLKQEDVNAIQKMLNDVEMLGGKRVSTKDELSIYVKSLEQEQAATINERNVIVSSPNSSGQSSYRARQADNRMVRGQGQSEKK